MERRDSGKLPLRVAFALTTGFVQRKIFQDVGEANASFHCVLSRQLGIHLQVRAVDIPYEVSNGRSEQG